MKIKKGDNVLVIAGKDKGRKGKVLRVLPTESRVVVEGINVHKKHLRPRRMGEQGQIVELATPIDASNVKVMCGKCGKSTRIAYKIEGEKKYRVCKHCGAEISAVA